VKLNLPPNISYESRPDKCLSEMLLSSEIDAAITARPPDSFLRRDPRIVRLFPEFRAEEELYYEKTGIFPIMHVISMRRSLFEAYPWVAMNMLTAFEESKNAAVGRISEITTSRIPLPWGAAMAQQITEKMGGDLWPYGVSQNRRTLDAFCRFAHSQYLTPALLTVEDIFPREVIGSARV
jgi:4,5-dihydroxyphthalate decarboxylase